MSIISKKGICYITTAAIIFGMMPICAKAIYASGGNSWFLSFLRFALALPLLIFADIVQKGKPERNQRPHHPGLFKRVLLLSVELTATPLLLFWSYRYISSALATTLHFIYPLLVLILCTVLFRERVSKLYIACCLLCIIGVGLFYSPNDTSNLFGMALAILSGVTYGAYIICLAKSGLQDELREYQLLLYLQGFGSLILLAINITFDTAVWQMPPKTWLLCCLFSFSVTAATFLFQKGTKLCGPQYAAFLSVLEPATSTIAGVLLLHEALTIRTVIGILCILMITALIANKK